MNNYETLSHLRSLLSLLLTAHEESCEIRGVSPYLGADAEAWARDVVSVLRREAGGTGVREAHRVLRAVGRAVGNQYLCPSCPHGGNEHEGHGYVDARQERAMRTWYGAPRRARLLRRVARQERLLARKARREADRALRARTAVAAPRSKTRRAPRLRARVRTVPVLAPITVSWPKPQDPVVFPRQGASGRAITPVLMPLGAEVGQGLSSLPRRSRQVGHAPIRTISDKPLFSGFMSLDLYAMVYGQPTPYAPAR